MTDLEKFKPDPIKPRQSPRERAQAILAMPVGKGTFEQSLSSSASNIPKAREIFKNNSGIGPAPEHSSAMTDRAEKILNQYRKAASLLGALNAIVNGTPLLKDGIDILLSAPAIAGYRIDVNEGIISTIGDVKKGRAREAADIILKAPGVEDGVKAADEGYLNKEMLIPWPFNPPLLS